MMEKALRDLILADAAVAAIVATRVYPGQPPQNPTLPLITYFRVSGQRPIAHSGGSGLDGARIQFECLASTLLAALELGAALRAVLQGYRGTVSGVEFHGIFFNNDGHDYGHESKTWRYRADFMAWSKED